MRAPAVLMAVLLWAGVAGAETAPFTHGGWRGLLDAHAGRPLVVHFWSLTCAPCVADLPAWAQLRRRRPDLAVVLVSTDPIDNAAAIDRMLARTGLDGTPSLAFATGFVDKLRFEVDRRWRGELPYTALVAPDGTVTMVAGALDDGAVDAWAGRPR